MSSEQEQIRMLERRVDQLEQAVLQLAARPLPGYDFHHPEWPPTTDPLRVIFKRHHSS